ncbi:hypothetical protein D3C84_519030 [compost metagenome]
MGLELGIQLGQEHLQLGGHRVTAFASGQGGAGIRRHVEQCQGLRQADAGDAGRLDARMVAELRLDGHGRDVLALGGLEQFLDPPGDAQAPLLVQFATVTGAEQAVLGVTLVGEFRLLEIAQHLRGALHQDLVALADAAFDAGDRGTDITHAHLPRQAEVGGAEVFRHAIAFEQLQAQLPVPLHHLHRQGRRAGQAGVHLVQAEGGEDLRLHQLALHRVGEGGGLGGGRNPLVDALVELAPQPRHGEEDGRPRTAQVFAEGVQAEVEEHPAAAEQRYRFHHRPLGGMGKGQIGQQAVAGTGTAAIVVHAAGHGRGGVHGAEAVHHALGISGTAGGIDDGGQVARLR